MIEMIVQESIRSQNIYKAEATFSIMQFFRWLQDNKIKAASSSEVAVFHCLLFAGYSFI